MSATNCRSYALRPTAARVFQECDVTASGVRGVTPANCGDHHKASSKLLKWQRCLVHYGLSTSLYNVKVTGDQEQVRRERSD